MPSRGQSAGDNNSASKQDRRARRIMPPARYNIAFSPVHVTEENIGAGLSLEVYNKNGITSVCLPVSFAIPNTAHSNSYNSYYYYSPYGFYPTEQSYYRSKGTIYFYPGIKIYPAGAFKKLSYAIGANLVTALGKSERVTETFKTDSTMSGGNMYYTATKTSETYREVSRFKLGALLSNSLNIRPTRHLYVGVEFGIGYSYLDLIEGVNNGADIAIQGGVKFGYLK
jgi:hypothetical protein